MHIVHLEDDRAISELIKISLTAADPSIHLVQFTTGDQTFEYAGEHIQEIDLFILDVRVPGNLSGLEVAKKLRTAEYPGPIIINSAYGQPPESFITEVDCIWIAKPWFVVDVARTCVDTVTNHKAKLQKRANAKPSIVSPSAKPSQPPQSVQPPKPSQPPQSIQPPKPSLPPQGVQPPKPSQSVEPPKPPKSNESQSS